MEVSERVALKQGRLHVRVGVCYIPLRIEVRIIHPPPLQSEDMDSRAWAYNTYSTVLLQVVYFLAIIQSLD